MMMKFVPYWKSASTAPGCSYSMWKVSDFILTNIFRQN